MLVAIEGIDGSGKGTQAALLQRSLVDDGVTCRLFSFPRYSETLFGKAVGDFLNGRFGSLEQVDPHLAALLYAGDRFESRQDVVDAEAAHDVVLFDRYVASNVAHQGAKVASNNRQQMTDWISQIEYDIYALPRTDLTVLLDLPVSTASELIARKAARDYTDRKADIQEADTDYLESVRERYLHLANTEPNWERVDVTRDDTLRSMEEIAAEIRSLVDARRLQ